MIDLRKGPSHDQASIDRNKRSSAEYMPGAGGASNLTVARTVDLFPADP